MDPSVLLIILDGWGYAPPWGGNAIAMARASFMDSLWREYPHTLLAASGSAVGLPGHEMGNSEVGHLNIGSGTLIHQDVVRINNAIKSRDFFGNKVLLEAMDRLRDTGGNLHLMGILSDGGIHGHINHAVALLFLAKIRGVKRVYIHAFTDGRDTLPTTAQSYIYRLQNAMARIGVGQIATIGGRYFAMDRDSHWSRIDKAYNAIAFGKGPIADSALGAVAAAYRAGQTDEFIAPTVIRTNGQMPPPIGINDSVIFWNFRSDRARQMTEAFLQPNIANYRHQAVGNLFFVSMIPYGYEKDLGVKPHIAFEPEPPKHTLASVLAAQKIPQFHIAETEKYAHVTYFFNGTVEQPYPGEDRVIVPSPKVPTFDKKPEMSAAEITKHLAVAIKSQRYRFLVANYANADMVGHSGNIDAAKTACHFVDQQLAVVAPLAQKLGYWIFITADHGNAEQMIDPMTNEPDTSHTTNPVPFIVISPPDRKQLVALQDEGKLSDIAPTILSVLNIAPPVEMTGRNLIGSEPPLNGDIDHARL